MRGGGDLGQYWYLDGKLLSKNHTFSDLIAAAQLLIAVRLLSPLYSKNHTVPEGAKRGKIEVISSLLHPLVSPYVVRAASRYLLPAWPAGTAERATTATPVERKELETLLMMQGWVDRKSNWVAKRPSASRQGGGIVTTPHPWIVH